MTNNELVLHLIILGFTRNNEEIELYEGLLEQYESSELDIEIWNEKEDTIPYSLLIKGTNKFFVYSTALELFKKVNKLLEK